ncbi:SDR family NAD(P)-dependent oxidoreductase [Azospirillum halopraeferens]|uniref:SDR family NAD(P)-dependent oxidoreductase n=1 Tax=Azospirillum halopraeferens TaxID=34010 RepID=UPI0003F65995|nr:SDR family NAD(P)-dependent oxidoreductase [Azospirillum halopraeferens]
MTGETWLILGASSAVARAFARAAAERGDAVLLAGRDGDDMARTAADLRTRFGTPAGVLPFDAADTDSHAAFVAAARQATPGTLNVFLAFALMPDQTAMETDVALALACIRTTYLGAVSVLAHLAPVLEAQGRGRVVVLGSVAGDRGRLPNHIYGSAKAGLHAYAQGLRARLHRKGVTVTTVKPGFLDTAMTWGLPVPLAAPPDACARACLDAAARGREVLYFPWFWLGIMTIIRAIPERIFKRLSI